ncbi:MlrC C-terminal domain-containing protein [Mesorhizobium sp. C280B]|uniref:MlrC C-terminal domain-containing protein n=1 Tax=Mesorhizobium sp. C280B TaxID=2956828 RepID=UPI0012EB8542
MDSCPLPVDPDAAAEAVSAGVGSTVSLKVGGQSSERAGGPVVLDCKGFMRGNSSTVLPAPTRREAR